MEVTRVIIPHVPKGLDARTVEAVRAVGAPYNLVRLSPANLHHYAELLVTLWRAGETFVIVEQDMGPTPGQMAALFRCGHRWCGYRYRCGGQLVTMALGVARIDATVMAAYPTLADQCAYMAGDRARPTPWHVLDSVLAQKLQTVGVGWIGHPGQVEHFHQDHR